MTTVWTNGIVTLIEDMVFGLAVLSEDGWIPLSECDKEDIARVFRLVNYDPSFPKNWEWPNM